MLIKELYASFLNILVTNDIPITHGGRKAKLLFNAQSLPDLKRPESHTKSSSDAQLSKPV